jgi:hypothetical protein
LAKPCAVQAAYLLRVATLGKYDYSLILVKGPSQYPIYQRVGVVTETIESSAGSRLSRIPWHDSSQCPVTTISLD